MRKNEQKNEFENAISEIEKHLLDEEDEHNEFAQKVSELITEINSKETSDKRGEYFFYTILRLTEETKVDTAIAITTLETVKFIILQKFYTATTLLTLEITRRLGLLRDKE